MPLVASVLVNYLLRVGDIYLYKSGWFLLTEMLFLEHGLFSLFINYFPSKCVARQRSPYLPGKLLIRYTSEQIPAFIFSTCLLRSHEHFCACKEDNKNSLFRKII